MNKRLHQYLLAASALVILAGFAFWQSPIDAAPVMSAAVSSDGHYAITAHRDNQLVLWDLASEERTTISDKANIYSVDFVEHRPVFVWQDLSNRVHIQTVSGETLREFKLPVPAYGHRLLANLSDYYYSDIGWGIYHRTKNGETETVKKTDREAFKGFHKLLNLSIDNQANFIVSAGSGEPKGFSEPYYKTLQEENARAKQYRLLNSVALWHLETGKPIAKLNGNISKTDAAISPDGQWVVSADENGIGLFWNTNDPSERHRMARYYSGVYLDDSPFDDGDPRKRDTSGLIEAPSGLNDITLAVAFIDHSDYFLRFGNNSHQAALFKAGSPWPQKYFDLGESPQLVTYGSQYSRNTAIATAPEAGVLVMGHRSGGGISVYRFDADTLTLKRTWVME